LNPNLPMPAPRQMPVGDAQMAGGMRVRWPRR
jgi:hypothetical protein